MTGVMGLLQLFFLSIALLAGVVALGTWVLYPMVRERVARVAPARRARMLTALAVAPLMVAVLQTGLFFLPGVLGTVWPSLDHCLSHTASDHMHLCFAHPPVTAGAWLGWLLVAGVIVGLGRPLFSDLMKTWRGLVVTNAEAQAECLEAMSSLETATPGG